MAKQGRVRRVMKAIYAVRFTCHAFSTAADGESAMLPHDHGPLISLSNCQCPVTPTGCLRGMPLASDLTPHLSLHVRHPTGRPRQGRQSDTADVPMRPRWLHACVGTAAAGGDHATLTVSRLWQQRIAHCAAATNRHR